MAKISFQNIIIFLLYLTAFVLGIKQLREPDFWWMLRTGEWILENKQIPTTDMFSYTFYGVEWINVKWGFEVLLAAFSHLVSPAFSLVIQSIGNMILLYVFIKTIKQFYPKITVSHPLLILSCILFFVGIEYRLNGRPELVSHVFTGIYCLYFIRYYREPNHKIFWLVLFQILWTNLHEAYGIGMVITLVFFVSSCLQYFIFPSEKLSKNTMMQTGLLTLLVILAPAFHPYGIKMIAHPLNIFGQVGSNKFTTELLSFQNDLYWQKEAYINLTIAILIIIGVLFRKQKFNIKNIQNFILENGLFNGAFLIMFFYLSFTAYRNIPFFIIVGLPFLVAQIYSYFDAKNFTLNSFVKSSLSFVSIVGFYVAIVSNFYYDKMDDGRDKYGLKVNEYFHPLEAANHIEVKDTSEKVFSDFLTSNYLIWKLQPNFRSFIDLRDLDIFPSQFFDYFTMMDVNPELIDKEDSTYNFKYAVILRTNFSAMHTYLYKSNKWNLVYIDPVSVVYQKDTNEQKEIPFSQVKTFENNKDFGEILSKILNPFYEEKYKLEDRNSMAADYFKNVGNYTKALSYLEFPKNDNEKLQKASTYLEFAFNDSTAGEYTKNATDLYEEILTKDKKNIAAMMGLATYYSQTGQPDYALVQLKKITKEDPNNFDAWYMMAQIESSMVEADKMNALTHLKNQSKYLGYAYELRPENPFVKFYYGISLCQTNKCLECREMLDEVKEYEGLSQQEKEFAVYHLSKCK